ncbi:hypothetical protein [Marinicella litoralis]|nr:hypothetical protein [Marinicella litoralis]
MKKDQAREKNEQQSPAKLTFLFILLPVLVVILMAIFWVIFTATRKQVELTEVLSSATAVVSMYIL